MRPISCWGLAVLFLAAPSGFPQSTVTTATATSNSADLKAVDLCAPRDPAAAPVDTSDGRTICTINKETLKPLQPTLLGRFARGFQYKYEIGEQQRLLFVGSSITENPEHYLNQHSLIFDFAELFTSPSELDALVKRIATDPANSKTKTQVMLNVCGEQVLKCLAGGGSMWKRAVSGLSITAALSERPALQQGIVQPEPPFFGHYGVTGQITFNPANLFITGANWKAAIDAAQNIYIAPCEIAEMEAKVGLRKLNLWNAMFRTFVPTFQFKRTSEFDFVKNGGTLIPAPFLESALNSYTFTWDLRKAIEPTAARLARADAASQIASYQDPLLREQPEKSGNKLCIIYSGSLRSFINVPNAFAAASCQKFAEDVGADHYALACVYDDGIKIGVRHPPKDDADPYEKFKAGLVSCKW